MSIERPPGEGRSSPYRRPLEPSKSVESKDKWKVNAGHPGPSKPLETPGAIQVISKGGALRTFGRKINIVGHIRTRYKSYMQDRARRKDLMNETVDAVCARTANKGLQKKIRKSLPPLLRGYSSAEIALLHDLLIAEGHEELGDLLTRCFATKNTKKALSQAKMFVNILSSSLMRIEVLTGMPQNYDQFVAEMDTKEKFSAFSKFINAAESRNKAKLTTARESLLVLFDQNKDSYSIQWINALYVKIFPPKHTVHIPDMVAQTQVMHDGHLSQGELNSLSNILYRSPELAVAYGQFLKEAQIVHETRPVVKPAEEMISLNFLEADYKLHMIETTKLVNSNFITKEEHQLLNDVRIGIAEITTPTNSQLIEEGMRCIVDSPKRTRDISYLRKTSIPWILKEGTPPLTLLSDGDELIDLDFSTFNALTDVQVQADGTKKMGDTIVLRIKFPFSGKMTKTEARKLIEFVRYATEHPLELKKAEAFDKLLMQRKGGFHNNYTLDNIPAAIVKAALEEHAEKGWTPQAVEYSSEEKYRIVKKYMHQKINEFADQTVTITAQGIANFGPSEGYPKGWVVNEIPEFKAFNADPKNLEKGLAAAMLGNVFLQEDGSYALLQNPKGMEHFAKVPEALVKEVNKGLLKGDDFTVTEGLVVPGDHIPITFSLEDKHMDAGGVSADYVEVTMSITIEGEIYTRTRTYEIKEGQTREAALEEAEKSGLIERDLLMAKAQFMKQAQGHSIRGNKSWWSVKQNLLNSVVDGVTGVRILNAKHSPEIIQKRADRDLGSLLDKMSSRQIERLSKQLQHQQNRRYLKRILDDSTLSKLERIAKLNSFIEVMTLIIPSALDLFPDEEEKFLILLKSPEIILSMNDFIQEARQINLQNSVDLDQLMILRNKVEHALTTSNLGKADKLEIRKVLSQTVAQASTKLGITLDQLKNDLILLIPKKVKFNSNKLIQSCDGHPIMVAWQGFINAAKNYETTKDTRELYVQLCLLNEVVEDEEVLNVAKAITSNLFEKVVGIDTIPTTAQALSGDRLTDKAQNVLLAAVKVDILIALACQSYLELTDEIQGQRPAVFDQMYTGANYQDQYKYIDEYATPLLNTFDMEVSSAIREVMSIQKSLQFGTLTNNIQPVYQTLEYVYNPGTDREIPKYDLSSDHQLYWEYAHETLLGETKGGDDSKEKMTLGRVAEYDIIHPRTLETTRVSVPFPFQGKMTKGIARKLVTLVRQTVQNTEGFAKHYHQSGLKFSDLPVDVRVAILDKKPDDVDIEKFTKQYLKKEIINYKKRVVDIQAHAAADFNEHGDLPKRWWVQSAPEMKAFIDTPDDLTTAVKASTLIHVFKEDDEYFLLPASDLSPAERTRIGGIVREDIETIATRLRIEETMTHPLAVQYISGDDAIETEAKMTISLKPDPSRDNRYLKMTIQAEVGIDGKMVTLERIKFYGLEEGEKLLSREQLLDKIMGAGQFQHDLVRFKGELMREIAERS